MIKQLFNDGYKYLYIPKRNKKTFYATKADCNFYDDDTSYDEFKAVNDMEVEMLSILPKNAFLQSQRRVVESFPILQRSPMCLN